MAAMQLSLSVSPMKENSGPCVLQIPYGKGILQYLENRGELRQYTERAPEATRKAELLPCILANAHEHIHCKTF